MSDERPRARPFAVEGDRDRTGTYEIVARAHVPWEPMQLGEVKGYLPEHLVVTIAVMNGAPWSMQHREAVTRARRFATKCLPGSSREMRASVIDKWWDEDLGRAMLSVRVYYADQRPIQLHMLGLLNTQDAKGNPNT